MSNAHALVAQLDEPSTLDEALSFFDANSWQEAIQYEYACLIQNQTWI